MGRLLRTLTATVVALGALLCMAGPALAQDGGPGYPRLGIWNPSFDVNTVEDAARFDLLVGTFYRDLHWNASLGKYSSALRRANPDVKLLTYYTAAEIWPENDWWGPLRRNPYLPGWPDAWFVTESGTTIAADIDARQTVIPVSQWQQKGQTQGKRPGVWDIFRPDTDVLCDGEIMSITTVDKANKTITVIRGRYAIDSRAHSAGVRIAPLVGFWPATYTMNLTNGAPRAQLDGASSPELWSEYHFRMSHEFEPYFFWDISSDTDGFMFDRMEDSLSWRMWADTRSVDLDRDNVSDLFVDMDSAWLGGVDHITDMFEQRHGSKAIVRNLSRSRRFGEYNGNSFESWPQYAWETWDLKPARESITKYWHRDFFGDEEQNIGGVLEYARGSRSPNYTLVVTSDAEASDAEADKYNHYVNYDEPGFTPNYRKMRWGLTSALVAGTYFGYEMDNARHGQGGLLWFDEYDDAGNGKGYLGQPVGDVTRLFTDGKNKSYGAWGREFSGGYVIVNPLSYDAKVNLPPGRWQRIQGVQDPAVNNGQVEEGSVTVPSFDGLILKRVL